MTQEVKNGIGMLILTEETLNRNRNRMIMYLDKGDMEGVRALIGMQKDECWNYMKYLRELRNTLLPEHKEQD